MKLYLHCHNPNCNHKIYLASNAKSRRQLANTWGAYFNITCPNCGHTYQYNVNQVKAETSDGAVPGALIGGLIGLLGGPIGLLLGGTVGGAISNSTAQQEVDKFNNNYL